MNYSEEIKSKITMNDLIDRYVSIQPKRNRIPCPLHNGQDYNFWFNDKSFYCFVCGEKGDIFKFVEKLFNINFKSALIKVNYDFSLDLQVDKKLTFQDKEVLRKESLLRKAKVETILNAQKKEEDKYFNILSKYIQSERLVEKNMPKYPGCEITEDYIRALKDRLKYGVLLEIIELEKITREYEKKYKSN